MADTLADVCCVGMSFYPSAAIFDVMLKVLFSVKSIFIHYLLQDLLNLTALAVTGPVHCG